MKILSRISATLAAGASDTVARFENHEAIGAAAIERCRRAVAAARLGERQHQRAAERFTDRRATAMADVESWSARAAEHAHSDDDTVEADPLATRLEQEERQQTLAAELEELKRATRTGGAS